MKVNAPFLTVKYMYQYNMVSYIGNRFLGKYFLFEFRLDYNEDGEGKMAGKKKTPDFDAVEVYGGGT